MAETDTTWPRVGDPPFGFNRAPDCPAVHRPASDLTYGDALPVYCTRDAGHPPPHVADGLNIIVHVWVDDDDLRAAAEANPDAALALLATLLADPDRGE